MEFNCEYCNKPIGCLSSVIDGKFIHHTCIDAYNEMVEQEMCVIE